MPKKKRMKNKITYEDVMSYGPCYDPKELGVDVSKELTISQFIKLFRNVVKHKSDIIWVLCRKEYMTDRDMRLFAVWCAREALKLIDSPDPRSIEACNVAERYANGKATYEELVAAWAESWDAASDAQIDKILTYFK